MKVLHITPFSNGYEVVQLLANRVNKKNSFSVIKKENDNEPLISGGFLINDTPEIRNALNNIPKEKQYNFVKNFKSQPLAENLYYNK